MGARQASATAVAAVLGAVVLVTLLGVWAASIGPGEVLRGDGPDPPVRTETETPSPTTTDSSPVNDGLEAALDQEPADNDVLAGVGVAIVLVFALALLYAAYRLARWGHGVWQVRDRPDPPAEEVEFDVLALRDPLVQKLARDAAAQRDALESGTPRNAIVEMWNRFEVQAQEVGARRQTWETSSEFTIRVLEAVDADSDAVARLAALYREARFSEHELTEDDRHAARDALAVVHRGLAGLRRVERT